jgi:hypothetical protein
MQLRHTEDAIAETAASYSSQMGDHYANHVQVGGNGTVMGEMPFDILTHNVEDIDMLSLTGNLTGQLQVRETTPDRPLAVNLVMHCDPEEASDPREVVFGRKMLIEAVHKGIQSSMMYNDQAKLFVVGEQDRDISDRAATYMKGTERPEAAAEAAAKICALDGLAIVISTFKNLPLEHAVKGKARATIGIKANHPWDLRLPNSGVWNTGEPEMPVVDASDRMFGRPSKELAAYHKIQAQRHAETVARLESKGIKVAEAVFDKQQAHYFDVKAVDKSIASAIKRAGRHSR